MSLTTEEKRAIVKALVVKLEVIADRHMGVIVRSAACGVDPLRAAIAMALIEAYELGAIEERARVAR